MRIYHFTRSGGDEGFVHLNHLTEWQLSVWKAKVCNIKNFYYIRYFHFILLIVLYFLPRYYIWYQARTPKHKMIKTKQTQKFSNYPVYYKDHHHKWTTIYDIRYLHKVVSNIAMSKSICDQYNMRYTYHMIFNSYVQYSTWCTCTQSLIFVPTKYDMYILKLLLLKIHVITS